MATILRLIAGLPPAEQRAFVDGLLKVLNRWLRGDHEQKLTQWPVLRPPKAEQPAPRARRKRRG